MVTTTKALMVDMDTAKSFLQSLNVEPGEVREIRIPHPKGRYAKILTGWHNDIAAMTANIQRIKGDDAAAVYVTLNQCKSIMLARTGNKLIEKPQSLSLTGDDDIARLTNLLIDVDSVREDKHVSATEVEVAAALELCEQTRLLLKEEFGWPNPAWIGETGNGGCLIYRVDLENTKENAELLRRVLSGLAVIMNRADAGIDTATFNPSRLVKIAGTIAAKGADMPDRPWRVSGGRANPKQPQPVSIASLQTLADLVEDESAATLKTDYAHSSSQNGHIDVQSLLESKALGHTVKRRGDATIYVLDQCLTSNDHASGAAVIQADSGKVAYKCMHERCQGKRWADVRELLGMPPKSGGTGPMLHSTGRDHQYQSSGPSQAQGEPATPRDQEEPEWPVLNEKALHGLAGDVVRTFGPQCEGDPVVILVSYLMAFGNAVGGTPYTDVGESRHYLNEYAVIVGKTSRSRKGTASSGPINLVREADLAWTGRIMGGLSSGEGLVYPIRDPLEQVKNGVMIVEDPGVTDKRLFVEEEEFSSALKVATREGNTVTEQLRKAWDGKTLGVMTRKSPLRATSPHVSIYAHITLEELQRTFDSTDAANGYGNRFSWYLARRARSLPDGGNVPREQRAELARRTKDALESARRITELKRDDEAKKMWHGVYEYLSAERQGMFGAITARAEAHVLRYSALYAILDGSKLIRKEHLLAALALWQYAEASARFIFGDSTGNPIADRIMAALRANGSMAQAEISDLFGRNVNAARLDKALEALLIAGLAWSERVPSDPPGGRPRTVWSAR